MSETLYTSDLHLGHERIIEFCGRPYRFPEYPYAGDVEAMNRDLIARWNARVRPEDTVWVLGDFALGDKARHKGWFDALRGHKKLCTGNHDRSRQYHIQQGWETVERLSCIYTPRGTILMQHHPQTYEVLDRGHYALQLCGHVHEHWVRARTLKAEFQGQAYVKAIADPLGRCINVGVDVRGFQPVTLEELLRDA
jgi:calcineurin-like phosphoesterase family protein